MSDRRARRLLLATGALFALLVGVVAFNSTRWIGRTFPGFLVMANRVVPSIALPEWDARTDALFQHQVVGLDDTAVASAAELYARVAAAPPGTLHRYRLRAPSGAVTTVEAPARRFSGLEYGLLFGAYLSTGIAFVLTGLVVVWLTRTPASLGLLAQSLTTGLFVVTAADLYGPHWFFRVHVVAESLLAAGFIHLACVFPTDRLGARPRSALAAIYAPFVLLAAVYQLTLYSPSAYTTTHLVASASHGLGALAITGAVAYDLATSHSPLVRRRVGIVALGTLGAFALPGALMAASALLGGSVPLNAGAFTAFLFPVSLGYAIVTQDLFEIDVLLRRAVTYVIALVAITTVYLAVLAGIGTLMPLQSLSPVALAILNLGTLLAMAPVKARAERAVNRVFARQAYDPERMLSELSRALSSARALADVEAHTLDMLGATVRPLAAGIWLCDDGATFTCIAPPARRGTIATLPPPIAAALAAGTIASRYDVEDRGEPLPSFWRTFDAEIVVPIRSGRIVLGALALDRKSSGRSYTEQDSVFLAALASQVALAITNARAFGQLADLNAGLEDQVASVRRRSRSPTPT